MNKRARNRLIAVAAIILLLTVVAVVTLQSGGQESKNVTSLLARGGGIIEHGTANRIQARDVDHRMQHKNIARAHERAEGALARSERRPVGRVGFSETLRVPAAWLSMAIFVFYVGSEIGIGQWAFVLLTESRSLAPGIAGPWVSAYWGAFTGGRILFGVVADRLITGRGLRLCTMGMVASAFLFWWNPVSAIGLIGMVLAGFAQGPVFPLLMSDTAARVGVEHAENTIGLQMGAVGIGTAILPGLIGTLGNRLGLEAMAAGFVILAVLVFGLHELTHSPAIQ